MPKGNTRSTRLPDRAVPKVGARRPRRRTARCARRREPPAGMRAPWRPHWRRCRSPACLAPVSRSPRLIARHPFRRRPLGAHVRRRDVRHIRRRTRRRCGRERREARELRVGSWSDSLPHARAVTIPARRRSDPPRHRSCDALSPARVAQCPAERALGLGGSGAACLGSEHYAGVAREHSRVPTGRCRGGLARARSGLVTRRRAQARR
jgi:hypothetical protein